MFSASRSSATGMTHLKAWFLKFRTVLEKCDVRVLLCIFAGLLIAALWTMTLLQLNKVRNDELRNAERDAISLSRVFKEHATRTVEGTDQAIVYLRHRYNVVGKDLNIAEDLKSGLEPDNIYNLFSIIDSNGDVALSSEPFQPMNLSDREHIKVHMTSDRVGLFISKPLLGRVSKKMVAANDTAHQQPGWLVQGRGSRLHESAVFFQSLPGYRYRQARIDFAGRHGWHDPGTPCRQR